LLRAVASGGQGVQTLHLAVGIDRIDVFPFSYEAGEAVTHVQVTYACVGD